MKICYGDRVRFTFGEMTRDYWCIGHLRSTSKAIHTDLPILADDKVIGIPLTDLCCEPLGSRDAVGCHPLRQRFVKLVGDEHLANINFSMCDLT